MLESNPSIDVVYDADETFYEDVKQQERWVNSTTINERLAKISDPVPSDELFKWVMIRGTRHVIWQIVARREVYNIVPPFCTEVSTTDDALILHQMIALCRFAPGQLNEPMIMHRTHDTNIYEGTLQRDPHRARTLSLLWKQHFWNWSLENLNQNQVNYVRGFLTKTAADSGPFVGLSFLRPGRIFMSIHHFLGILTLPHYFHKIWISRIYWISLIKALFGKR